MKKFLFSVVACLVFIQASNAAAQPVNAKSALSESLAELQAILNALGAPDQDVVKPDRFVVDILRKTDELNTLGKVKYLINTCQINKKKLCKKQTLYLATLRVKRNPAVGPHVVIVKSIKKIKPEDAHSEQ